MPLSRPFRLLILAEQLEATSLLADPFVSVGVGPAAKYVLSVSSLSPNPGDVVNVFAQLADTNGNAVSTAGLVVTWTHTSGGTFSAGTSTTDASGLATVQFTVGSAGDVEEITATDTNSMSGISSQIHVGGSGVTAPLKWLRVYDNSAGVMPTTPADAPIGRLLMEVDLGTTTFGPADGSGVKVTTVEIVGTVSALGFPAYARVSDSTDTIREDFEITNTGTSVVGTQELVANDAQDTTTKYNGPWLVGETIVIPAGALSYKAA